MFLIGYVIGVPRYETDQDGETFTGKVIHLHQNYVHICV